MRSNVDKVSQLEMQIMRLEEENNKLKQHYIASVLPVNYKEGKFPIYTGDVDTYEPVIEAFIDVNDAESIEQKIILLADTLSKQNFDSRSIELIKLETTDGKQIATINLKNNKEDSTWESRSFQGSSGGICTTISLEETFLQKEYSGEWIDGVQFLYEGNKITDQHVEGLWETIYR